jgi:hypothetical protein
MLVASLVVASAAIAGGARAQETAAAETLFNDGRALLAQGRYAEACAKLTESERLDAAVGTLLNLGDCYEKMGRIATAWAVFRQAAGMALTGKQPARQKIADGRVAALEPKIPKLALVVTHPTPGLEVRRDGTLLGAAEWSASSPSALAMDPGDHEIVVSAPGKKAWSTKVTLAADGQTTSLELPALEADELAERAPLKPQESGVSLEAVTTHDRDVQRVIAIVTGGVGAVSVLVGVSLGAHALTLNGDAKSECPTNSTCTAQGASDADGAVKSGTVSTILISAGAALVAGGVVLFLTAPQPKHETRAKLRVVPILAPGAIGLSGSF